MADREYIRPPVQSDFAPLGQVSFRFFQQIAHKLNFLLVQTSNLPTYANNADAVTGGLGVGYFYKTITGELRIVV